MQNRECLLLLYLHKIFVFLKNVLNICLRGLYSFFFGVTDITCDIVSKLSGDRMEGKSTNMNKLVELYPRNISMIQSLYTLTTRQIRSDPTEENLGSQPRLKFLF